MSGIARDENGAIIRDGKAGCRCCGSRHIEADGMCGRCIERGHIVPPPDPRQQTAPRDRQLRHPGRDR